ncbi:hypothetical protein EGW08_003021 [Elysia chlorotica]|uniref:Uncharacterized protein n=1 Tax=Elysia chlorotica TaxID=188477 RepID=A0A3S1BIN7_ELYCH|nr:hypothetical protein EGW08_003021 [Elysia chlorotica]
MFIITVHHSHHYHQREITNIFFLCEMGCLTTIQTPHLLKRTSFYSCGAHQCKKLVHSNRGDYAVHDNTNERHGWWAKGFDLRDKTLACHPFLKYEYQSSGLRNLIGDLRKPHQASRLSNETKLIKQK